jgi:hypothetical protein
MIASWLANKLAAPILLGLSALLILLCAMLFIRIHGFPILFTGYVQELREANASAQAYKDQWTNAVDQCNKATAALKLAGDQAQAEANAKIADAQKALADTQAAQAKADEILRKVLDNAKPEDTRQLGPTVLSYLNGVRMGRPAGNQNSGSPSH